MPIIIKPHGNDSTGDLIKRFKKAVITTDVVQKAKDRRYYKKPSQVRAERTIERLRLQKRTRSLKKMKNISPQVIARLEERISS
jgi:ribosomal protein S21